jgi:hypothetical protein
MLVACLASTATAQTLACTPVGPPPAESLRPTKPPPRPALPSCANEQTGRSTCRKVEADRYNAAIADFNAAIFAWNRQSAAYANALEDWQRAATHYAQCEIDAVNADAPR